MSTRTTVIGRPALPETGQTEEHFPISVLDAYLRQALPDPEMARVQHHIVLCRECRDLLLDLASFLEDAGREGRLWSAELTSAWEEWVASLENRRP